MVKRLLRYLLIAGLGNLLFLFAPKDFCKNYEYCPFTFMPAGNPGAFHAQLNVSWDSFEFMNVARRPSLMLQPQNPRQSRPVFIAMGSAMGHAVWYLGWPLHKGVSAVPDLTEEPTSAAAAHDQRIARICFLTGFILLNVFVLIACCWLFEELLLLLALRPSLMLRNMFLFALSVNQLTKLFCWSAHTQMFTLLVPLACLFGWLRLSRTAPRMGTVVRVGLIGGLGLLVYGNFILLLPSLLLGLIFNRNDTRVRWKHAFLLSFSFLLPTIAWILFLKMRGVTLFNLEIAKYRQFVWVFDTWAVSPMTMIRRALLNVTQFTGTLWILSGVAVLTVLWLLMRGLSAKRGYPLPQPAAGGIPTEPPVRAFLLKGMLPIFLLTALFIWGIGCYADRISFGLMPFFLVALATDVSARSIRPWQRRLLTGAIIACWLYTWLFDLPHFGPYYYI